MIFLGLGASKGGIAEEKLHAIAQRVVFPGEQMERLIKVELELAILRLQVY